jgi:uncharacterized protein
MNPESRIVNEIVRRIVNAAHPQRIIMFGSAAKGEMTRNSDIDLLVIKPNVHRGDLTRVIYREMKGVGHPVDIVVARPEDLEEFGDSPGLVFSEALRSGKVIYDA